MVYRALTLLAFTVGFVSSAPTGNCKNEKDAEGNEWAFIVAGSNTSFNEGALHSLAYLIQGSAYRAYHALQNRGIPAERIVVFSWDDAAFIDSIPKEYKGQLFNSPDKKDVRAGVAIDYKGSDVNKANILAALSGNKAAIKGGNGRVLESTSNDKVFVYFVDHGGPGVFYLGGGDETISKKELQDTLKQLHADGKYSELTFYMDACHSGSMFDTLPTDLNIYAVTSASPAENANAVYCPPIDDLTGEVDCPSDDKTLQCVVKQCLGALFSGAWLHGLEQSKSDEILQDQYESIKEIVAKAPEDRDNQKVSQYGKLTIAKEPISQFEGKRPSGKRVTTNFEPTGIRSFADVGRPGRSYLKTHDFLESFVKAVLGRDNGAEMMLHANLKITNLDCHHDSVNAFLAKCMQHLPKTQAALHFAGVIGNLCESGFTSEHIVGAMDEFCA